jgi:hypothetical protein
MTDEGAPETVRDHHQWQVIACNGTIYRSKNRHRANQYFAGRRCAWIPNAAGKRWFAARRDLH